MVDLKQLFGCAGRRALVTGGSVSIGRAIALGLAAAGADVAIQLASTADAAFGRPEAGTQTCRDVEALGRAAVVIDADFGWPGEARRAVRQASEALGGLDILVICASIQSRVDLPDIDRADLDRQVGVNLAATVELLQEAVPPMAGRGWGRVLSIGSVNQTRPDPTLAVYAALKAAQHNLILNLARQYAPRGVTFNTLSPGLVATERNRWRQRDEAAWVGIQARANPMRRAAQPDEMVGAALLFCSDAGAFITGADLQATGGGHL